MHELRGPCKGCSWDSVKRHEISQERIFNEAGISQIPVEALFGQRPEHNCGRPGLDDMMTDCIGSIATYRSACRESAAQPRDARKHLVYCLQMALNELELTR